MNGWQIAIGIVMMLVSIFIIIVVLFQQGRRQGVGAISGAADTFLSKNKARSADTILSRFTKFFALGFFVLAIVANVIASLT